MAERPRIGLSWARLARPGCSTCPNAALTWGTVASLLWTVPDLHDRKRLTRLGTLFGLGCEAWYCPTCGAWGVFSPDQWL